MQHLFIIVLLTPTINLVYSMIFDIFFKRLLILLFLGALSYVIYLMLPVIVPFVVAFILAYLLNPIVKRLERYMNRFLAILVVYANIVLIVALMALWAVPAVWEQFKLGWSYLPMVVSWYNDVGRLWLIEHTNLEPLAIDTEVFHEHVIGFLQTNYQSGEAQSMLLKLLSSGMSAINIAGMVVLIPILTFYFLMSWQARLTVWAEAVPRPYRAKTLQIAKDCDCALMSFVKGQFLVMFLLGAVYAVQLQLLGLDLGLAIGMMAGVASFVPYLGFGVGIVSAIIAGLLQFGLDWVQLGMIVGAFMVGQAVEGYVLQPLLLGDKIGLSPLWVIFSVLAGASMFGFVGMLIALPVSAILNVLFHHAYHAYKNSAYYQGHRQYRLFD